MKVETSRTLTATPSLVVLSAVFLFIYGPDVVDSGCAEVRRCCQGKDNECRGLPAGNSVELLKKSNRTIQTCFCDAACLDIGDCCDDYRQQCPPVDCVLSDEWQPWSDCSVRCGRGTRRRVRRVVLAPMNGGKPCDSTVQKGICHGKNCKQARAHGHVEMRETAKLLPASYGQWRQDKLYNPYLDIRRNLFEKYYDHQEPLNRATYCAVYELTEVTASCSAGGNVGSSHYWADSLRKGVRVCAECQSTAMIARLGGRCRGAGLYRRQTSWMAVGVPGCHGSWVMKTRQEQCQCSDHGRRHAVDLILV